jgi:PAS domain S-box-containing protein
MSINVGDVRRALDQGLVEPCFQPIVELRSGRLVGFEVLTRCAQPEGDPTLPLDFIAAAESEGLIERLTHEVVRKAFQAAHDLPVELYLSINISPVQLSDLTLPHQIARLAEEARFPLKCTVVEITESALMMDVNRAKMILNELHAMGCRLALDDFGTGYSSLSHLHSFPFDKLKIDISFVRGMVTSREGRKIVASIIGIGHSLGMKTIAEGVETEDQAELLLLLGCEFAQGWLYGRCSSPATLPRMIAATPRRIAGRLDSTAISSLEALPAQRLAQLQAIYDGAPVGLAFVDADLRYVSINARLAALNGKPVSEHLGRTIEEVIPESFLRFKPYLERALRGEVVSDKTVKRPSPTPGGREWTALCSYQPAWDEAGELIGVSIAVLDISDRARAEGVLRKSEAQLRAVFEAVPLGIFISESPNGVVTRINEEAKRIHRDPLAVPPSIDQYSEWGLKHTDGEMVHADDYPLALALLHNKVDRKQMVRERTDGSIVLLDVWAAPVRGHDGETVGAIAVVKDIDATRKIREHLLRLMAELKRLLLNSAAGTRLEAERPMSQDPLEPRTMSP